MWWIIWYSCSYHQWVGEIWWWETRDGYLKYIRLSSLFLGLSAKTAKWLSRCRPTSISSSRASWIRLAWRAIRTPSWSTFSSVAGLNPPASWRWQRQLNIKQCLMQADMWHMDTYGWDCSHVFCVWGISWNFQHFSHVFFFCDPFFWVTKVVRPLPWSRNFWFPDSPSLAAKSESVRPRFVGSLRGPSFASAGLSAKSTTGSMVKCSTQRMIVAGYLFTVRNAN